MATDILRNLPSEQMVIALINRDNNLMLSSSDVVITNVHVNPNPTEIVGIGLRDTEADVLAVFGGDFKENSSITYRRLDAVEMFSKVTTVLRPNNQGVVSDLLADINDLYGLALQRSDIVEAPIDISVLPITVSVVFKENNPAWTGSFPVTIQRLPVDLSSVVTQRSLPVLRYPTGQSTLIQGDLYLYAKDFTEDAAALVNVDFNTPLDNVITVLNKHAKPDVWVIRAQAADFNLNEASVIYNGPVIDTYSTRRGFTRLLVIQLDTLCANMTGRLLFHYNG